MVSFPVGLWVVTAAAALAGSWVQVVLAVTFRVLVSGPPVAAVVSLLLGETLAAGWMLAETGSFLYLFLL